MDDLMEWVDEQYERLTSEVEEKQATMLVLNALYMANEILSDES